MYTTRFSFGGRYTKDFHIIGDPYKCCFKSKGQSTQFRNCLDGPGLTRR